MSKKAWILISCLVLSLTLGLGGSLAYLTDTDTKINTFTMGNVDIEVEEDFEQEKASDLRPGIDIRKAANIVNTGSNRAWVWMEVAVPAELRPYIELYGEWMKDENDEDQCCDELGVPVYDEETGEQIGWDAWRRVTGDDGVEYDVITIMYNEPLEVGDKTHDLLHGVRLNDFVDKRNDGSWWYVENGHEEQINFNGNEFNIVVSGFAVQWDGINNVHHAYEMYNQQWGEQQVPNIDSDDKYTFMVHSTEELQAELNDPNNKVITLASGNYGPVTMGDAKNVMIRAAVNADAHMQGIRIDDAAGLTIEGLHFDGIIFEGNGIQFDFSDGAPWSRVEGLTVTNCQFYGKNAENGGRLIDIGTDSPGSHQMLGVHIDYCYVDGAMQGLRLGGVNDGAYIGHTEIKNVYHNAITLRSGKGDILIEENTIENGGDRAFRIGTLSAPATVTYKNNTITNTGDPEDGSNFKANEIAEGAAVVYNGETYVGYQKNLVIN